MHSLKIYTFIHIHILVSSLRNNFKNNHKKSLGVGWDEQVENTGTWGSDTALCDTIMMDTCHHTLGQTHRIENKNKP